MSDAALVSETTIQEIVEEIHYLVPAEVFDDTKHWAGRAIGGMVEVDGYVALIGETTYQNRPAELSIEYPEFAAYTAEFV